MFEYFEGSCSISGKNEVVGVDKVDVTPMEAKCRSYMYGNIKCEYSESNRLGCEKCSVLDENKIRRYERFY